MGSSALLLSIPINYSNKCHSYGLRWTLYWAVGWGFAAISVLSRIKIKISEYSYLLVRNHQSQVLKLSWQQCLLSWEDRSAVSESSSGDPSSAFLPEFPARMETGKKGWKMGLFFFLETQRLVSMFYNNARVIVLFLYLLVRFVFSLLTGKL